MNHMNSTSKILLIIAIIAVFSLIASIAILGVEDMKSPKTDLDIPDKIPIPTKIIPDDYEIMKQKYDNFLIDYNKLVESQRNVIPYPINYGYVTGEGWIDTERGIVWCSNLYGHTVLIQLLFGVLNDSLDQFNALENKTPQMVELIDTKYNVLSNTISKEIKSLEYKFFQVHCASLFD